MRGKLSTGEPSTLGGYRDAIIKHIIPVFGGSAETSAAIKYLDTKIAEAPNGADEEVLQAESQMVCLLCDLHVGSKT